MQKYRFIHRLHNGGWSEPVEREVFERGHAIAVLPYDPVLKKIVLIEQVRIGAWHTSETPWCLEVVAGIIDEGESETDVCAREAKEEAGIELHGLYKALSFLVSPGGATERIHVYMAKVDASLASGIHGLDEESEDILVHSVDEDEVFGLLDAGKIDNSATVIALQWLALHKQVLINHWEQL